MSTAAARLLSDVHRRLPAARNAMFRSLGTIPAAGGSQGNTGPSDRTGRLACAYIANPDIDPARRDLDRLDHIIERARSRGHFTNGELAALADLCDTWNPTARRRNAINDNLRAAANDLLNKHDDHGNCRSCARDPEHKSYGEPFRRGLCVNCYRRVQRINELYLEPVELPPVRLVVLMRERGKVTDRDIHTAMNGATRRET